MTACKYRKPTNGICDCSRPASRRLGTFFECDRCFEIRKRVENWDSQRRRKEIILDFAGKKDEPFTAGEIPTMSQKEANLMCSELARQGRLERVKHGLYRLP